MIEYCYTLLDRWAIHAPGSLLFPCVFFIPISYEIIECQIINFDPSNLTDNTNVSTFC